MGVGTSLRSLEPFAGGRQRYQTCRYASVSSALTVASLCLCPVDADEIKRLGKRFKKLDLDNSGSLSVEEFMSLPELQQNPLVQRVIDIFDTDGNGEVDFKGTQITGITKLLCGDKFLNRSEARPSLFRSCR